MKKIYPAILSFCLLSPIISFASSGGVTDLLKSVGGIVKLIIPIMAGVAVVYFFWGCGQFILHSDDEKTRENGKQKMLWGVIAIAVIFSIAGIIAWLGGILGTTSSGGSTDPGTLPCPIGGTRYMLGQCTGD